MFEKIKEMYQHYGSLGLLNLIKDLILTRFVFPKARLIRFPFEVRGKAFICIKSGFTTGRYCRIETYPEHLDNIVLKIGRNCQINDSVHIVASREICIEDNVLIGSRVFISDLNHGVYSGIALSHSIPESIVSKRALSSDPVFIGSNTWIGENVSILSGVKLGRNCIVGANSLVNKSFPENSIVGGNPAKILKKYNALKKQWEPPGRNEA